VSSSPEIVNVPEVSPGEILILGVALIP